MRILSLEVQNIRGIKSINLSPAGQNVVVYGPNGTGKSAIVDAIDFLLTGKISRLTGEGSKVLDIREHGCHVDFRDDLKKTIVRGLVQLGDKEVLLERSINKPSSLKVEPKEFKEIIEKRLEITELGQHILTRRDILEYITAEAGKRAKKVMSLLDLDNIGGLRATFVALKNEADAEDETAKSNLEIAKNNVSTLLELDSFSDSVVMGKVNELRQTLNGLKITSLSVENIKKDLKPYLFGTAAPPLAKGEISSNVKGVRNVFSNVSGIASKEAELKALLTEVQKDKVLKKCVLYKTLIETGIRLLDDSNICPLCGREWDGNFSEYLAEKEKETEIAREKQDKINDAASFLSLQISLLRNYIDTCVKAHKQFGLTTIGSSELDRYLSELSLWQQALTNPLDSFESGRWPSSNLRNLFGVSLIEAKLLVPLDEALMKIEPKFSQQQLAWDTLTKMEERWEVYVQALEQKRESELFRKRANSALDKFEVARNSVLEAIYDAVKADFEKYYKIMHGSDEGQFSSDISHEGAELNFKVDFYQRGKFPPHALHSEGHQDSMGFCLFFALNRYLVKDAVEVIILDDVVMSIDSGHRRGVCDLLKSFQSDRQFVITTHDAAWAKQLKSQGIVTRANMIHFANWNIETGPIYEIEKDLWVRIEMTFQLQRID